MKVLIVDDDKTDAEALARALGKLEGYDFDISFCSDPFAVEDRAKDQEFELIFLDYRLGLRTGLEIFLSLNVIGVQSIIVIVSGQVIKQEGVSCVTKDDLSKESLLKIVERVGGK